MEIKAVAIDLDGTLLNSEHKISEYNKKILMELKKKGVKILIATGRIYTSLYKYKKELELDTPVICYNGAVLYNGGTDEKLFELPLEEDVVRELVHLARERNIHLNLFQEEKWYVEYTREELEIYKESSGLDYHILKFEEFESKNFTKLIYISDNEKLLEIEKIIEEKFGDRVYKAFSKPHFLEILHKDVSKGKGLEEALKIMKISPENVIAFGDGYNDYEMLNYAGIGVIMGNAPEKLKGKFKYIAKNNDESGVGVFLKEFLNIKGDEI